MIESEDVKRFLLERGCPDDVVEAGLEGLVEGWERTAGEVQRGYSLGLDDYLNDLDGRQLIAELRDAFPGAASPTLLERIAAADALIEQAVSPVDECLWGEELADREGWTAEDNWWYFRLPRNPGSQMREELQGL